MTDSPLLTTSPDAITELFSADPRSLSDAQLDALILEFRRRRNDFIAQEAVKATAPKRASARSPQEASAKAAELRDRPAEDVSLGDLL